MINDALRHRREIRRYGRRHCTIRRIVRHLPPTKIHCCKIRWNGWNLIADDTNRPMNYYGYYCSLPDGIRLSWTDAGMVYNSRSDEWRLMDYSYRIVRVWNTLY